MSNTNHLPLMCALIIHFRSEAFVTGWRKYKTFTVSQQEITHCLLVSPKEVVTNK
jgi:hypothetical protein